MVGTHERTQLWEQRGLVLFWVQMQGLGLITKIQECSESWRLQVQPPLAKGVPSLAGLRLDP